MEKWWLLMGFDGIYALAIQQNKLGRSTMLSLGKLTISRADFSDLLSYQRVTEANHDPFYNVSMDTQWIEGL